MTAKELMECARKAAACAYAPYSGFSVGAALECSNGEVFSGCNVENASSGCAICAERTAAVKAVSAGCREFSRIAVYSPDSTDYCTPCGICRQVLAEFSADMEVICGRADGQYVRYTLRDLLPAMFTLEGR